MKKVIKAYFTYTIQLFLYTLSFLLSSQIVNSYWECSTIICTVSVYNTVVVRSTEKKGKNKKKEWVVCSS